MYDPGQCFAQAGHYFMQREKDVLHLNVTRGGLINSIDVDHLVTLPIEPREISRTEFLSVFRKVHDSLGLDSLLVDELLNPAGK